VPGAKPGSKVKARVSPVIAINFFILKNPPVE
jgi:hypothetical protein